MNTTTTAVRVRFAPSPTGNLHIGGLRTALFNWFFARRHGGAFLVRIEDTDKARSEQQYTDSIIGSLAWTGIEPDEPLVYQAQRAPEHMHVAQKLLVQKKAYRCWCTPEQVVERHDLAFPAVANPPSLSELRRTGGYGGQDVGQDPAPISPEASKAKGELFIKYDGFCKDRVLTDELHNMPYAIRFALPSDEETIEFQDLIRGHVSFGIDQFDDFIIVRSDGGPMYNFGVVVDDAFMRISHVIRGEEHLVNTPKQILLYRACDYAIPYFAHLPLILGESGAKLSKRDAATSVLDYKQQGYLPDALVNYLARLGWSHGDQEIFSKGELVEHFSLEQVGKKGAIFDMNKLMWLNSVYLRALSPEAIIVYITNTMTPSLLEDIAPWLRQNLATCIALYQERVQTLGVLVQELMRLSVAPTVYDANDVTKWVTADTAEHIATAVAFYEGTQHPFEQEVLSRIAHDTAKLYTLKLAQIAQPLRIALIGSSNGPGVFALMACMGKTEVVNRLKAFIVFLQKK